MATGACMHVQRSVCWLACAACPPRVACLCLQVVVAEGAPKFDGHLMAKKLSDAGIQTTLIPDSAVFAMMARAHKVRAAWGATPTHLTPASQPLNGLADGTCLPCCCDAQYRTLSSPRASAASAASQVLPTAGGHKPRSSPRPPQFGYTRASITQSPPLGLVRPAPHRCWWALTRCWPTAA